MKRNLINLFKTNRIQLNTITLRSFQTNSYFSASTEMSDYVFDKSNENKFQVKGDKFWLDLPNGQKAHLDFKVVDQNKKLYEFYYLEVPDEFKGKGVAEPFTKKCFDYAKQQGWKVKPSGPGASYLSDVFLRDFGDEYKDIIQK
ncbi:hypothetical protein ABK040_012006 [Willaertia magna]